MPSLIADFQEAVRTKNAALNADLFAEDVRVYGLMWKPIIGKPTVLSVMNMMLEIIEDLEYVAEYEAAHGIALHIRGRVGNREVDGVQLFRFNDEILVEEVRNFVRPQSACTALVDAATEYLARKLQEPDSRRA